MQVGAQHDIYAATQHAICEFKYARRKTKGKHLYTLCLQAKSTGIISQEPTWYTWNPWDVCVLLSVPFSVILVNVGKSAVGFVLRSYTLHSAHSIESSLSAMKLCKCNSKEALPAHK